MQTMVKKIYFILVIIFCCVHVKALIKTNRPPEAIHVKYEKFDELYYFKSAQAALKKFQIETFKNADLDLDLIFLKIEKKVIYQDIKTEQRQYFQFQNLTNSVLLYANQLKNNFRLAVDPAQRSKMQMNFYGLSQAIKKANQMNLTIQSDQFDKLHDILVGQSTALFYSSYTEKRKVDLFWCAYFLHELNYPMDLTAKHLMALDKSILKMNQPEKYKIYGAKLAKMSLGFGQKLNQPRNLRVGRDHDRCRECLLRIEQLADRPQDASRQDDGKRKGYCENHRREGLEEAATRRELIGCHLRIRAHHLLASERELRIHYRLHRVPGQKIERDPSESQEQQGVPELPIPPAREDGGWCEKNVHEVFPEPCMLHGGIARRTCWI